MSESTCRNDVVTGMWKFRDSIAPEALIQLAEDWKNGPDGSQYLHLYVRQCSKDQYAIGFMYNYEPEDGKAHKYQRFFDRITDQLKRRFGNSFVGWDVSSPTWIVE